MQMALDQAQLKPEEVDYINLHGTGTPLNDSMEAKALCKIFTTQLPLCSSTKFLTGHTLGAAGALEAAFSLLSLGDEGSHLPVHHFESDLDPEFQDLNFVQKDLRSPSQPRIALSNSFAFGGSNCSLVFEATP